MDNLIKRIKGFLGGNKPDDVFYLITHNDEVVEVRDRLTKKIDDLVNDLSVLDFKARNLNLDVTIKYVRNKKWWKIGNWQVEIVIMNDDNTLLYSVILSVGYFSLNKVNHFKTLL